MTSFLEHPNIRSALWLRVNNLCVVVSVHAQLIFNFLKRIKIFHIVPPINILPYPYMHMRVILGMIFSSATHGCLTIMWRLLHIVVNCFKVTQITRRSRRVGFFLSTSLIQRTGIDIYAITSLPLSGRLHAIRILIHTPC